MSITISDRRKKLNYKEEFDICLASDITPRSYLKKKILSKIKGAFKNIR